MPEGTKVDTLYKKLLSEGHSEESAARIAQSVTGEALATGKPPKHENCSDASYQNGRQRAETYLKEKFGNASTDTLKIILTLRDPDGQMLKFLKKVQVLANPGHSFGVVVDPKSEDEETFGFDGDGAFFLKDIEVK